MTSHIDNQVRVALYRLFVAEGALPATAKVAGAVGLSVAETEDCYRRLAEQHAIVLEPGTSRVRMANPLSAVPTAFRVSVGASQFHGNCIWDSLGIIAMLGGTGAVRTHCPDCTGQVELDVSNGSVRDPGYVVHYSVPAAHWWDDIIHT